MNNKLYKWPVMPLSVGQLKDIYPKDVLNNGLYRLCDISHPSNFDSFSVPAKNLYGYTPYPVQFVVQLKGCPLKCPYCYVTEEGIHGKPTYVSTKDMVDAYYQQDAEVFHLMGGAPALYMEHWPELIDEVQLFHSDMLLVEQPYDRDILKKLKLGLYAVSIKSLELYTQEQVWMLMSNLKKVVASRISFYLTITGDDTELSDTVLKEVPRSVANSVIRIEIRDYKALSVRGSE